MVYCVAVTPEDYEVQFSFTLETHDVVFSVGFVAGADAASLAEQPPEATPAVVGQWAPAKCAPAVAVLILCCPPPNPASALALGLLRAVGCCCCCCCLPACLAS
eukprot:COSAG01_NODE_874_length_12972_cov_15.914343_2_plen_104_part_00